MILENILDSKSKHALRNLEKINGYKEFLIYIEKNIESHFEEVTFEIRSLSDFTNNNERKLLKICSYKTSMPEGILEINGRKAILESSVVSITNFHQQNPIEKLRNQIKLTYKDVANFTIFHNGGLLVKKPEGYISYSEIRNINERVIKKYKEKRRQHKKKFPDSEWMKVYYFLINDVAPSREREVDEVFIRKQIKNNEIIILSFDYAFNREINQLTS
jgi:hypothetical protein